MPADIKAKGVRIIITNNEYNLARHITSKIKIILIMVNSISLIGALQEIIKPAVTIPIDLIFNRPANNLYQKERFYIIVLIFLLPKAYLIILAYWQTSLVFSILRKS
jgi:hypothetical protein